MPLMDNRQEEHKSEKEDYEHIHVPPYCDSISEGSREIIEDCLMSVTSEASTEEEDGDDVDLDSTAHQEHEDEEEDDLPIDKGWAWVVVAGVFLNAGLMIGYIRGLSILFVEYLHVFNASTAKTTLLMGVNAGVFSFSALLSMHILVSLAGIRKTMLIGSTITTLAMATAIAPPNIDFLIALHSTLLAIGNSMIIGPGSVIIGQYFKKRYAFATALSMSGISVGVGVYPPLVRYLLDEYGLQGTMIILTGLCMNLFVGSLVCVAPESFRKKHRTVVKVQVDTSQNYNSKIENHRKVYALLHSKSMEERPVSKLEPNETDSSPFVSKYIKHSKPFFTPRRRTKTESDDSECHSKSKIENNYSLRITSVPLESPRIKSWNSKESPFLKNEHYSDDSISRPRVNALLHKSLQDLGSITSITDHDYAHRQNNEQIDEEVDSKCGFCHRVVTALDFTLFKKPMFILIVSYSFFSVNTTLAGAYLPALCAEKNISQNDAAIYLTMIGGIDFFCRLIYGFLVDKRYIKVNKLMAFGIFLLGTACNLTYFFNSYVLMLIFAIIQGIGTPTYFGLMAVAVVEFMGIEYLGKTLGFMSLFHGISIAIANPIIGGIVDLSGSYMGGFLYIGCTAYIGATLLLLEPIVRRRFMADKNVSDDIHVGGQLLNGQRKISATSVKR